MTVNTVMLVFGTRPEAIKLCPLALELRRHPDRFRTVVCVTAQHRQMLDQVLPVFGVDPDHDLDLMTDGQSLADLTGRAVQAIAEVIGTERPDVVIVQGDTTTSFAAALAAFYHRVPVAHVEAGLRTGEKYAPFPEEINRRLTAVVADLHFAATPQSQANLRAEGTDASTILITGNTVIDALLWLRHQMRSQRRRYAEFRGLDLARRIILVTGHRRENFGSRLIEICTALKTIAERHPDVDIVYPVHLNPNVTHPVHAVLGGIPNVKLINPLPYEPFVFLMDHAYCIISDSGGIQEEAPSLGKPVLVTRETTERPEAIEAGIATLVGSDHDRIVTAVGTLLTDEAAYARRATTRNPFGDGQACVRIVHRLAEFLGQRRLGDTPPAFRGCAPELRVPDLVPRP